LGSILGLAVALTVIGGGATAYADTALERFRPVLRYDADERHFAQPEDEEADVRAGDRVYGHLATEDGSRWLQYWFFYAYNAQDRGVLKTGRHEGDWELAQFRLDPDGRPDRATLAQHSWAEGCDWDQLDLVELDGGQVPVLYIANGSHATYSRPGTHDRPWPDPNDEADGRGRAVRPSLEVIDDDDPAWVARREPWGDSRAGPVPGEQSSPPGPRFQPDDRWARPASFDRSVARDCGSGPPGRAWQNWALALVLIGAVALVVLRRRRNRPGR